MADNIIKNDDGTYSVYTHKKGAIDLIRYTIQDYYKYMVIFDRFLFKSCKDAKSCFDFLESSSQFKKVKDSKFTLHGMYIKLHFTSVKLCTFVDELERNPDYVKDREKYYASLNKSNL